METSTAISNIHKGGSLAELESITPKRAAYYLEQSNKGNRKLNPSLVKFYAAEMLAGNWQYNGDPVRFDSKKKLIDGQHRLAAIIASGKTINILVVRGLNRKCITTIDTGRKRTSGDILVMEYGLKSGAASAISGCIKLIAQDIGSRIPVVKGGGGDNPGASHLMERSNEKVLNYYKNNVVLLDTEYDWIYRNIRKTEIGISPSEKLFLKLKLSKISETEAENFMLKLVMGTDLAENNPILQLRSAYIERKTMALNISKAELLLSTYHVWNMYRNKRKTKIRSKCLWRTHHNRKAPIPE